MTKVCSKCGVEKDVSEFHKQKKGKYGVKSICKVDMLIYVKEYKEKNIETVKAKRKIFLQENKEYHKAYQRAYYHDNKESKKNYYTNNKENILKKSREKYSSLTEEQINMRRIKDRAHYHSAKGKAAEKRYKEKHKDEIKEYNKIRNKKLSEDLPRDYMIKYIIDLYKIDREDITEGMIELKRSQLKLKRAIKHVRG